MGLDDIAGDAKEEIEQLDDDDIEELSGDIEEYMERVDRLSNVMVNMDSRMEQIREDMASIKRKMSMLEELAMDTDTTESETMTENTTEDGGDSGGSHSWRS